MPHPVDLKEKLALVTSLWDPRVVAALNDYHFKIARIEGEFVWHSHPDTDEAFLVIEGRLRLDFRDGAVELEPGQLYVVPRGVEHRPVAEGPCGILMVEPAGTVNTGDAGGERTRAADEWI